MLYLIIGNNKERVDKIIEPIRGGKLAIKMNAFSWDPDLVRSRIQSQSLFEQDKRDRNVFILDNIKENQESFELLKSLTGPITESEEGFFLLEEELEEDEVNFFKNLGAEIFDTREKKEREYEYSPFALQDAVGQKSAKTAWIEYTKLRLQGVGVEGVTHNLISKARDMLGISLGASKKDLGIKSDFPYNKSKKDSKNWKKEELEKFYSALVSAYHESRMGGEDLDTAVEKLLLGI